MCQAVVFFALNVVLYDRRDALPVQPASANGMGQWSILPDEYGCHNGIQINVRPGILPTKYIRERETPTP